MGLVGLVMDQLSGQQVSQLIFNGPSAQSCQSFDTCTEFMFRPTRVINLPHMQNLVVRHMMLL